MAAALAKVLRGGCSGASSQALTPSGIVSGRERCGHGSRRSPDTHGPMAQLDPWYSRGLYPSGGVEFSHKNRSS
uniref:Uncharacterized protein n=1 Tax=Setaria viridis TaxID=4556 RepID=A0A4U6VJG2_SETVI|nr:hypothetical protein SEVIR_3G346000v2 [Setaria viridis]